MLRTVPNDNVKPFVRKEKTHKKLNIPADRVVYDDQIVIGGLSCVIDNYTVIGGNVTIYAKSPEGMQLFLSLKKSIRINVYRKVS